MTLVDLPARTEVEDLLGFGRGGGGWQGPDDDPDYGWGWSEEPFDEVPYRRPRAIRALAIVLALMVVTGSVGAYVAVMTVSSDGQYSVSDIATSVARASTGAPSAEVSFVVSNQSTNAGRARCTALVRTAQAIVGSTSAVTGRVPGGTSRTLAIRVPLSSEALVSDGSATVEVGCVLIGHHSA